MRDVTKTRFSIRLVPIRDWQWPCSVPSPTCRAICLDRILPFLRQQGTTATRKHLLPMQRHALLLILATLMASSAATAQAPPTPATPPAQTAPPAPARNPTGCAPTQSMPQQGTIAPQGTTTTDPQAEPLSDKLARSDGVFCPPTGVDPEIRAPTPETGNMPVIPPPGSPGGDPTIRPK